MQLDDSGYAQQLGIGPLPDGDGPAILQLEVGQASALTQLQPPCWTWAELTLGLFFLPDRHAPPAAPPRVAPMLHSARSCGWP